jgi:antitoxin (DNA-binding transcriptional repressor) of toxin-antitoxin stability system
MQVNLRYAEEHLADLGDAVDAGQEVEISRPDKPSLKLVISSPSAPVKQTGKRILGAGRGELRVPSWEEWQAMDKDLARQMNDSPLFPSDEQ